MIQAKPARRWLAAGTVVLILSALPSPPLSASQDRDGVCTISKPGADSARRVMKSTLQPGALGTQPRPIAIADFIDAPHLQLTRQSVVALRSMIRRHEAAPLQAKALWVVVPRTHQANNLDFVGEGAQLRQVSPEFAIGLRPLTTDAMTRVMKESLDDSASVLVRHPNVNDVISASLGDGPIAQAVPIGGQAFHEGEIVRVTATVLDIQCEADGDHHFALGDRRGDPKNGCIIVEIPNPATIHDADLRKRVQDANAKARTVQTSAQVTVEGQLFYDAHHAPNSRGIQKCATTLWEVHPITAVR